MSGDVGLVAAFGGGLVSFVSPCVLPLVPGYVSLISGVSLAELRARERSGAVMKSTLGFVGGFTLVFTALGAAASSVGQWLRRYDLVFERASGVVLILLGLFLAGFVTLDRLERERRFAIRPSQWGAWGAPVAGMAFAFGWTPCIGPVLAGVLTQASQRDTLASGVALLFAYSLGLGVPFIATGLALDRLAPVFSWVRKYSRPLMVVAGAQLIAFGILLFSGRVGWLAGRITELLDALGLDFLTSI